MRAFSRCMKKYVFVNISWVPLFGVNFEAPPIQCTSFTLRKPPFSSIFLEFRFLALTLTEQAPPRRRALPCPSWRNSREKRFHPLQQCGYEHRLMKENPALQTNIWSCLRSCLDESYMTPTLCKELMSENCTSSLNRVKLAGTRVCYAPELAGTRVCYARDSGSIGPRVKLELNFRELGVLILPTFAHLNA